MKSHTLQKTQLKKKFKHTHTQDNCNQETKINTGNCSIIIPTQKTHLIFMLNIFPYDMIGSVVLESDNEFHYLRLLQKLGFNIHSHLRHLYVFIYICVCIHV